MGDDAEGKKPLYQILRAHILSGASLWSFLGFLLFTATVMVFISFTTLNALDWLKPVSELGARFYQMTGQSPEAIGTWLAGAAEDFEGLRTDFAFLWKAWFVYGLLFLTLALGLYGFSFAKLTGESALDDSQAEPGARSLLQRFGYFKDIVLLSEHSSYGHRQTFYIDSDYRRSIKYGKDDKLASEALFFMSHEYAHVPLYDNLLHSVIRITFNLLTAAQGIFLALLCGVAAMLLAPGASALLPLYVTLVFLLTLAMVASVILAIRGFRISYIKTREYFADEAARMMMSDGRQHYNASDSHLRPSRWSAFSTRISSHERALHETGESFHARNLLVFFWPVWLALRSLYLLTAPQGFELLVLVFDGLLFTCFVIFARSLPRPVARVDMRPLTPWIVTSAACLTLLLAYNGILGWMFLERGDLFSDMFRLLIATPVLIVLVAVGARTGYLVFRRICAGWTDYQRQPTRPIRSIFLFLGTIPGIALETCVFILNIIFFIVAALMVWQIGADEGILTLSFLISFLLLTFIASYIALQYLSLLMPWRRLFIGVLILSVIVMFVAGSFTAALLLSMIEIVQASSGTAPLTSDLAGMVMPRIMQQPIAPALAVGTIGCIFYLVLRSVEFRARGCLRRLSN